MSALHHHHADQVRLPRTLGGPKQAFKVVGVPVKRRQQLRLKRVAVLLHRRAKLSDLGRQAIREGEERAVMRHDAFDLRSGRGFQQLLDHILMTVGHQRHEDFPIVVGKLVENEAEQVNVHLAAGPQHLPQHLGLFLGRAIAVALHQRDDFGRRVRFDSVSNAVEQQPGATFHLGIGAVGHGAQDLFRRRAGSPKQLRGPLALTEFLVP